MMTKFVLLPLSQTAAFALFTQKISEWWPPDRRHTQDPGSEIFLLSSGRFYERARDGREVELGKVRTWDCPRLLVLDFYVATGADNPTEVEIAFTAEERGTRVTVTHRPKPESEILWSARVPRYGQSWDIVLAALARAAA
jgi:Activator of Hsp90 ATPase homolog 1-like protein